MALSALFRRSLERSAVLLAMLAGTGAAAQDSSAGEDRRALEISPYIEVAQVLTAEIDPRNDTITYSQIAVGVDAIASGRNNAASVSLRYERNIGWGDRVDSDSLSGIARGYHAIVPQTLSIEAGALASRTVIDGEGASLGNPLASQDRESRIYSAYAGPNLHTRAGDVEINAVGRIGYTRLDAEEAIVSASGEPLDVFDDSVTYRGEIHMATRPGEPLPVGLGLGAGYYREDISNLDQRLRNHWVRGDVTVPLTATLAAVGGVGYEKLDISSRDALRDANGAPIVGSDGRFVTDPSAPRQIAYETDGLIWDAGVLWRPSRRTSLEARVGERYDSTTYYASFNWAPNRRSAINLSAYDGVTGFGGVLTDALAGLPNEFEALRNGLTSDFTGCVTGEEGAQCLGGLFGSVRSATFRARGVRASYARRAARHSIAFGAGYDRRRFIAAAGTVLGAADGVVDESYYLTSSFSRTLGRNSAVTLGSYVTWFDSGFTADGDVTALGASLSYSRRFTPRLSGRAALAYDQIDSKLDAEDLAAISALLGLRYDF